MRVGVLFPDESSFYEKMGIEIFENYPEVQKLYRQMRLFSGMDLKETLIYQHKQLEWNETEKRIAVLLTGVALYRVWYDRYKIKPLVFYGNGVGVLSALVCAGTIKLPMAIRMLRKDNWVLPRRIRLDGSVFMCSAKSALTDPSVLRIQRLVKDDGMLQGIIRYAQHADLDSIVEIGPDCRYTMELRRACDEEKPVFAFLDTANDPAYILESFAYKKHFNNLYAAKRMLGIAAATQNYSNSENDEKIVNSYHALKAYVDEMQKKQVSGRDAFVSEYDFGLCVSQLNDILRYKCVSREEVQKRILLIQNEIAIDLKTVFHEWFRAET